MGAFCNLLDWYRFEKYRPDFASNMRLHSLEYRLTYYNFAKGFFDRFIDKRQFIDINKLINKTVYNMLLKDHSITSRIVDKCREIDFKEAFTTIGNRFIDPEVRGLIYKLKHDVIPTNVFWLLLCFGEILFEAKRCILLLFPDCDEWSAAAWYGAHAPEFGSSAAVQI